MYWETCTWNDTNKAFVVFTWYNFQIDIMKSSTMSVDSIPLQKRIWMKIKWRSICESHDTCILFGQSKPQLSIFRALATKEANLRLNSMNRKPVLNIYHPVYNPCLDIFDLKKSYSSCEWKDARWPPRPIHWPSASLKVLTVQWNPTHACIVVL